MSRGSRGSWVVGKRWSRGSLGSRGQRRQEEEQQQEQEFSIPFHTHTDTYEEKIARSFLNISSSSSSSSSSNSSDSSSRSSSSNSSSSNSSSISILVAAAEAVVVVVAAVLCRGSPRGARSRGSCGSRVVGNRWSRGSCGSRGPRRQEEEQQQEREFSIPAHTRTDTYWEKIVRSVLNSEVLNTSRTLEFRTP